MMLLGRIRESGNYIAIIGSIGVILTYITGIVRRLLAKNRKKVHNVFDWVDRFIWFVIITFAVLDIFTIIPKESSFLMYILTFDI